MCHGVDIIGTRENLVIPGSVEIEGRQYQTVLYKNMFLGCDKTTIRTFCIASDVKFPDDSEGLFRGLSMMDTLTFGPDLDTSNVTNIEYLFDSCKSLKQLDLSMWDTGGVTSLNYLFRYCQCLEEVNLDGLDELEKEKQNENEESYQSSFKEDDVSGNQKDTDGDSSEEEKNDLKQPVHRSSSYEKRGRSYVRREGRESSITNQQLSFNDYTKAGNLTASSENAEGEEDED